MRTAEEQALFQLDRWLGYEVKSTLLLGLLFLLPMGPVVLLLQVLLVVFMPIMIVQLYRAKWFKTLAFFVLIMAFGFLMPRSVSLDPRMEAVLYPIFLFVPFYFFCWVLKWVVSERVSELKALEKMRVEDALRKSRSHL
jgi:hypothetical protein